MYYAKNLLFLYNLAGTVLIMKDVLLITVSVGIFVPTNSYISACYKSCPSAALLMKLAPW